MKIETKFNIGDRVFFIENDKVSSDIILKIEFTNRRIRIIHVLFSSKEELIESL